MRDYVHFYLNGIEQKVYGDDAFMPLSDYLRFQKCLTGTKVVCAEGDCGACTILKGSALNDVKDGKLQYHSINSCIAFVYLLDGSHVITVEGLTDERIVTVDDLHPVQKSFVLNHGAQCGYCTPGFVCAIAGLVEADPKFDEKKAKNYLTGNLCRCTGYEPILKACETLDLKNFAPLKDRYHSDEMVKNLQESLKTTLKIISKDKELYQPASFDEALEYKSSNDCKATSGATDLGVVSNKGRYTQAKVVSLNNITSAYEVLETAGALEIGAKASLETCEKAMKNSFPEFSRLLHVFASPQIKNKGTLVGNVANGSPIGDTIPFLLVAESELTLISKKGERQVNLNKFYLGYKQFDLAEDELISKIEIPKTKDHYKLYKVSIRKDLDISAVTFAARVKLDGSVIKKFSLALGGVGPTVQRISEIEADIAGATWSYETFNNASKKIRSLIKPLSDVRGSDLYRLKLCENLIMKYFYEESAELNLEAGREVHI